MESTRIRRLGSVLLTVLLALSLAGGALVGGAAAHGGDDGLHHHDGFMGTHGGVWGWGFLWMPLGLVVLVALGVGAFVLAARDGAGSPDSVGETDSALETLRQRYASGEIDEEEFERRRSTLTE